MPSENRYILFEDKSCFVGVLHQIKNRQELALKRQGVKLTQLSREGHLLSERTEDGTADDMVANPLSRAYGKRPLSAELRKLPSTCFWNLFQTS